MTPRRRVSRKTIVTLPVPARVDITLVKALARPFHDAVSAIAGAPAPPEIGVQVCSRGVMPSMIDGATAHGADDLAGDRLGKA